MTPSQDIVYLVRVHYVEKERMVVAEFENGPHKEVFRTRFFPHLLTDASEADLALVVSPVLRRQLWCEDAGAVRRVFAGTFSLLQKIRSVLSDSLDSRTHLVSPESQFLLAMNWRLWQRFEWAENEPKPLVGLELPFVSVGFLSNNLHVEVAELLGQDEAAAASLCDSIIWSNWLCVAPELVPRESARRTELFLQHLFFANDSIPPAKSVARAMRGAALQLPLSCFENTAEFDFSKPLVELSLPSGFNLGFETVDCHCCSPSDAAASNLLPHSLVRVRILNDGFFFQSVFSDFAESFHRSAPDAPSRLSYMEEFGFAKPPIGPLFAGMLVEVPLADAQSLESSGQAVIAGLSAAHWVCRQKKSFWSAAVGSFAQMESAVSSQANSAESNALSRNGLGGLAMLSRSPSFWFDRRQIALSRSFSVQLLSDALSDGSAFFSEPFGRALAACRELVLNRFFEFNAQKGTRVLVPRESFSVFVQSPSAREAAAEFAAASNLPLPSLSQWHFTTR